jgi:DNA-binding transcriptional LysR family regulator
MDANARNPDDLTDLERRLADWRPDAAGLDPDAMLFAAGRASVRPSPTRFVWPAIAACMTMVALGLGGWAAKERTGRLELARLVEKPTPAVPTPVPEPSPEPPPTGSYFAMSRLVRQNPDAFLDRAPTEPGEPVAPSMTGPSLRAWPISP